MFIYDLSDEQKRAFLVLAKKFTLADSASTENEEQLLELFRREVEGEIPADALDQNIDDLAKKYDTPKAQITILLELITLGYVDGEFSEHENQFIMDLARSFGITIEKLAAYASWSLHLTELQNEAKKFWESGS